MAGHECRKALQSGGKISRYVVVLACTYLLSAMVLSYAVDVAGLNIFGLGENYGQYREGESVLLWMELFREASLTEVLQWIFLGLSVVLSLYLYRKHKEDLSNPAVWLLLCLGLTLMFFEDSQNWRHRLSGSIGSYLGYDIYSLEFRGSTLRTSIEIIFYAVLGSIMSFSFYKIVTERSNPLKMKAYLCLGYLFYAIAAIGSATRNIEDWYARAGARMLDVLIQGRDLHWGVETLHNEYPLGFWFMDYLLEESLELLGAACILAAVIVFFSQTLTRETNRETDRTEKPTARSTGSPHHGDAV